MQRLDTTLEEKIPAGITCEKGCEFLRDGMCHLLEEPRQAGDEKQCAINDIRWQ